MTAGEEFDVVIAGAGAGGSFAAMALTQAGLRVLLLERGRRFDFRQDYPLRYRNWENHDDVLEASTQPEETIQYAAGARIPIRDRDLCSRFPPPFDTLDPPRRRGAFRYLRVQGVGGSTLHYQGEAHRFPPHAFRLFSLYGWDHDWPIDYQDLAPFYAQAERILGVAGDPNNPFKARRGPYPTPAHQLTARSQLVHRGAAKLGWSLLRNSLALPSVSVDGRSPCQHTGGCVLGCPFGAKSSADRTALARAERTGRLTLRSQARLLEVEIDRNGRVAGYVYRHDQTLKRAQARRYVLALGGVETPRMLLANRSPAHPMGIGNRHDQLGRYFMETIAIHQLVEAEMPVRSYQGPPLDARIWDFNHPEPHATPTSGYVLGVLGGLKGNGPAAFATSIGGFGKNHKDRMRREYGTRFYLIGIAEQAPRFDNRLMLGEERDAEGIPKALVESDFSSPDKVALRAMIAGCRTLADAAALRAPGWLQTTYSQPNASHVGGGCRMGNTPETSVTDAFGRVHGVGNLYITDASTLVTQGAGDSPSLTIQALALRTAKRIATLRD